MRKVMKLTGKCKEDFEKWLDKNHKHVIRFFYVLDENMKYGVYVDYFDSVDIHLDIYSEIIQFENSKIDYASSVYRNYYDFECFKLGRFQTRNEARTQAIIKANNIYNANKS